MTQSDDPHEAKDKDGRHRKIFKAVAVFYAAALLLNAEGLHRNALRLPYGHLRDAAVAVTAPVATLGRKLGLTKIRSWVEQVINEQTQGLRHE